MKKQKVYLCLENGQTFEGYRFGAGGEIQGELVFTTGMGGYIETLTDPSYYGQIVLQTFPLIGNYGFIPEDMESPKSYVSAYIVREYCQAPPASAAFAISVISVTFGVSFMITGCFAIFLICPVSSSTWCAS